MPMRGKAAFRAQVVRAGATRRERLRVSELGPQIGLRLAARGPWLRDGRDRNVSRASVSYSGAGMRPPGWFTTNVYEEISWARSAVAVSSGATTASRPSVGLVVHVALGIHDPRRGRLCRRARRRGLWWWLLPRTDELRQERPAAGGLFLRRLHYLVRESRRRSSVPKASVSPAAARSPIPCNPCAQLWRSACRCFLPCRQWILRRAWKRSSCSLMTLPLA